MYARPVYISSCFSLGEKKRQMKPEKSVTLKKALMWFAVLHNRHFSSLFLLLAWMLTRVYMHSLASGCLDGKINACFSNRVLAGVLCWMYCLFIWLIDHFNGDVIGL